MGTQLWGYRCSVCYTFNDHNDARWEKVYKDEENERIETRRIQEETEKCWVLKARRPIPCKAISHCELYYLTNNLNHHWIRVARQLGFITQEIDDISREETLLTARAARMLRQWLNSTNAPSEIIRSKLVTALRNSHLDILVTAMIIL